MLLHLQCVQINMEIKRQLENLKKKTLFLTKSVLNTNCANCTVFIKYLNKFNLTRLRASFRNYSLILWTYKLYIRITNFVWQTGTEVRTSRDWSPPNDIDVTPGPVCSVTNKLWNIYRMTLCLQFWVLIVQWSFETAFVQCTQTHLS